MKGDIITGYKIFYRRKNSDGIPSGEFYAVFAERDEAELAVARMKAQDMRANELFEYRIDYITRVEGEWE